MRGWLAARRRTLLACRSHPVGTHRYDITVTNSAGIATRRDGFTYGRPDAFNLNGTWMGYADGPPDSQIEMSFTITNDVLVNVSCGSMTQTPAPEFKVGNGEFSFQSESGIRLTARILSDVTATGEIHFFPCSPTWYAKNSSPKPRSTAVPTTVPSDGIVFDGDRLVRTPQPHRFQLLAGVVTPISLALRLACQRARSEHSTNAGAP